ncbi:MAG: FAD-dependent oxidoreductase [Actinomycetota bacterium]|nr:FAD-dependent oxidoreductase [Actinomycetota bacterium]
MTRVLVVGGSDAGISASLRARELAPEVETTLVVADSYPNFSICGIPYHISGKVPDWHSLAHRSQGDLEAAGLQLLLEHTAQRIDPAARILTVTDHRGTEQTLTYDTLIVATGATPIRPPITGLGTLGPAEGVHLLHTMDDTFALNDTLTNRSAERALIVGAGYIGMEMADSLTVRGLSVTVVEALPQVLPTVDPELATLVEAELVAHGVEVVTGTTVTEIRQAGRELRVSGAAGFTRTVDLVLVVVGVFPDATLATAAGAAIGVRGALAVDPHMRTNLPDVFAAGDCVHTHHRLLPEPTYLPLGTTAHKQGRVAGENAVGGDRTFAGSLGTQVVKIFDLAVARTGLRHHEAATAGFAPRTVPVIADDHKVYYPGAQPVQVRVTGDTRTGQLLGVQMLGATTTGVAKRIDTAAAALYHHMSADEVSDLDLSYTPPLGSPWDILQAATQAWGRQSPARLEQPIDRRRE